MKDRWVTKDFIDKLHNAAKHKETHLAAKRMTQIYARQFRRIGEHR